MFEKEAEEYAKQFMKTHSESDEFINCKRETDNYNVILAQGYELGFQKGAEFGYNKANEWHFMKDVNCYEDLPQNKDVFYAYIVNVGAYDKPTIEYRLGSFNSFEFDVMAYHVIAWKEIVLPKEVEE